MQQIRSMKKFEKNLKYKTQVNSAVQKKFELSESVFDPTDPTVLIESEFQIHQQKINCNVCRTSVRNLELTKQYKEA